MTTCTIPTAIHPTNTTTAAAILRKQLRRAFPATKFSVRSMYYAGGSTISVRYAHGPAVSDVEQIVDQWCGRGFDGMTDSSYRVCNFVLFDGIAYEVPGCFTTVICEGV